MKGLSIEQKAKAYDEAIERAKEINSEQRAQPFNIMTRVFPELAESEDEKIIKELLQIAKESEDSFYMVMTPNKRERLIAWLEKQERKPADSYCQENCKGFQETGKCFADGECKAKREAEQKPAWSEEDNEHLERILKELENQRQRPLNRPYLEEIESDYKWLKSIKNRVHPKHEWKQENTDDLTDFENAMMHIGGSFFGENAGLDPNDTNAIKEQSNILLELVPKQEWSEEDENNILFLTAFIEECFKGKEKITLCGDTMCANFTKEDVIERLKSIRPQWKPSKEQIKVLEFFIPYVTKCSIVLEKSKSTLLSLLSDLKKLKG